MSKRAFITGITGQDGSYLAEFLLGKGYDVYGLVRRTSNNPMIRFKEPGKLEKIKIIYGNMRDSASIERALEISKPDEIYNLAAQSDVGISFQCPEEASEVNYYGVGRLVNEAMRVCPQARIYQASTSEMFGRTNPPQNEGSLFQPVSPYGRAKLKAHEDYVTGYRNKHGLFICSGILFNHESPRRGEHFVTRKITISLAKIKHGLQERFQLGNLDAKRDWGFAKDYVEAMWRMLQEDKPDDFVIATGEMHTVREFAEETAKFFGMDIEWDGSGLEEKGLDSKTKKVVIEVNPAHLRPNEVDFLQGDSSKAERVFGWKHKTAFKDLVRLMAEHDLEHVKREKLL